MKELPHKPAVFPVILNHGRGAQRKEWGTTNDPHRSSSRRNCTLQSSSRFAAGNQGKIRHCAWSNSQHARTTADDARWSEEPCPWPETNRTRRREESRPWRGPEEELARRHRPARAQFKQQDDGARNGDTSALVDTQFTDRSSDGRMR